MKPRLLIIDLQGLPEPQKVLDEARAFLPPERILVVAALGTVASEKIERLGYSVISRPASIGDVVATATKLLRRASRV
jgi:hypothetical protein